jgi:hypothetical protein
VIMFRAVRALAPSKPKIEPENVAVVAVHPTKVAKKPVKKVGGDPTLARVGNGLESDFDRRVKSLSSGQLATTAKIEIPCLGEVREKSQSRKTVATPTPTPVAVSEPASDVVVNVIEPETEIAIDHNLRDADASFRKLVLMLNTWGDPIRFKRNFSIQHVDDLHYRGEAVIYRFGSSNDIANYALAAYKKGGYAVFGWGQHISKWNLLFADRDVLGQRDEHKLNDIDPNVVAALMLEYVMDAKAN